MVNLFVGFDPREEIGYHVFCSSVIQNSTVPVSITPLHKPLLRRVAGEIRDGTNAFTLSRFLIPYVMYWTGRAIFMDGSDMLMRGDIAELDKLHDPWKAVQVVPHDYKTKHPRKYIGTEMEADNEDYPRKNWASVMLINCAHYAWRKMTPAYLSTASKLETLNFSWMDDRYIGYIGRQWNWLDEYGHDECAQVIHWTTGIPGFEHYKDAPFANEWFKQRDRLNGNHELRRAA